jgi:hypothetical protein
MIRSVRSFASIRSQGSNSRNASKDSSQHQSPAESQEHITSIELVADRRNNINTKVTSTQSVDSIDIEAGNATESYIVDP